YRIFGPAGINVLRHDNADGTSVLSTSPTDVVVTEDVKTFCPGFDLPVQLQWDMHLGQSFTADLPFDLGVDLPPEFASLGFHLGANGGLRFQFSWDVHLGFGVSITDGFYLVTGSNTPGTA